MPSKRAGDRRQRGIALIMVVLALTFLASIVFEFTTNTTLQVISASNMRDQVRSHFLARSGANLGQLVIRVQTDVLDKLRQQIGDIQLADYTSFFMGAFGGSKEEVAAMGELLGGFAGDAVKGLGVDAGTFDVQVTNEDGRINVNCASGSAASKTNLYSQLQTLFQPVAYNELFQNESDDGWRRTREEQAKAIIDYVDRDTSIYLAPGTPEPYGYQSLKDPYLPKNNYLDTVSELKLVRGVDDRFWTLFGSNFTVYGSCRINLGAVREVRLLASVLALSAKNPNDPVLRDPTGTKLWALATQVLQAGSFGGSFNDLKAFAEFVKDPNGGLAGLAATLGAATGGTTSAAGLVDGMELDQAKLAEIATIGPRRVYRVEVTADVGRVHRRLTAIWDTSTVNQNPRRPEYSRGTWVYWKEE